MMTATVEQLLARLGSGIESTAGVCGGDPRIAGTQSSTAAPWPRRADGCRGEPGAVKTCS